MVAIASWYNKKACRFKGEEYVVNPKNPVNVRSRNSVNSKIISHKAAGAVVCGIPQGEWLALTGRNGDIKFKIGVCPLLLPVLEDGIADSMELQRNFHVIHKSNSLIVGLGLKNLPEITDNTVGYRNFERDFFNDSDIRSVTDIGCGSWELNSFLNWTNIRYVGVETVKHNY